ncbi:MAG: hypothetical protein P4M11_12635 [Candidatus Pacebacteria bacterium]|nr:hypothetical protein [Candidatus Paceibacterota bacterium]
MIDANKNVFSQLFDWAKRADRPLANAEMVRWIHTTSDDRNWLKNLVVDDVFTFSPRVKTAIIQYAGLHYFIAVGFDTSVDDKSVFTEIDINAGMFTALIQELAVPVRLFINPLKIIEDVSPSFQGIENYDGHQLESIAGFFEPIIISEVNPNSPIMPNELIRMSFFWLLKNQERITLPFSADTISEMERIVLTGARTIPFSNLVYGIQCSHWQHAFLEIYRCIERLFSFQIIEDLHKDLSLSISLLDFSEKIESVTGWRPLEQDAIRRLFGLLPATARSLMEGVRNQVSGREENISKWIYGLRNSVVHFRPVTKQLKLTDHQWDEIFRAALLLVAQIYAKYDSQLQTA